MRSQQKDRWIFMNRWQRVWCTHWLEEVPVWVYAFWVCKPVGSAILYLVNCHNFNQGTQCNLKKIQRCQIITMYLLFIPAGVFHTRRPHKHLVWSQWGWTFREVTVPRQLDPAPVRRPLSRQVAPAPRLWRQPRPVRLQNILSVMRLRSTLYLY